MSVPRTTYAAQFTPDRFTFVPESGEDDGNRFELNSLSDAKAPSHSFKNDRNIMQRAISKVREVVRSNSGMLLIAGSEAFFAPANVAVKALHALDPPVGTTQLIWVRMVITWVCCIIYMHVTKVPDPFFGPKGVRILLVGRGLGGFIALFGVYFPVQYLSLADATTLTFLAPILTTFTGVYFLGELFSWGQVAAGLCSLSGVILIARPPFLFGHEPASFAIDEQSGIPAETSVTTAQRLGAVIVALFGALGATCSYTIIRAIGHLASPMHSIVAFSSLCVVVTTLIMIVTGTELVFPARAAHMAMLLMIGFCGFFAQVLMTMGLQREAVGRGTMAVYIQVVYAIMFDMMFFVTTPSMLSILGILIIVSSAIYVAASKETISDSKEHASGTSGDRADASLEEGFLATQDDEVEDGNPTERPEFHSTIAAG